MLANVIRTVVNLAISSLSGVNDAFKAPYGMLTNE